MASLYEKLRADIILAVKARDSGQALILRSADAAVQRASLDQNVPIDDELVIATLRKAVKNLAAANLDFEKGNREDLISANLHEIEVLETYLPQLITGDRLQAIIDRVLAETGATSRKEMGRVIGAIKKHPDAALIDFGEVSKALQGRLA
ncbi:MAG: GatB/YqeY domain-containing protein [Opitutaceae bacterium]